MNLLDCARQQTLLPEHVRINSAAIAALAKELDAVAPPAWDEEQMHVNAKAVGVDAALLFCFVVDAINFCFWVRSDGADAVEYFDLSTAVRRHLPRITAATLQHITEDELNAWLEPPSKRWPLVHERVRALRELGHALELYGPPRLWVEQARNSAVTLCCLIVARLPMFRDETVLHGRRVVFLKRAQILVADIWGCLGRPSAGLGSFVDIASLTCFADYRVPQLLRDRGVLEYSVALAAKVDARVELAAGSEEEVAIRAATIVAVERVRAAMRVPLVAVEVDWLLWQRGEKLRGDLAPHHCTRTWFY